MSAKTLKYSHAHSCKSKASTKEYVPAMTSRAVPQPVITEELIRESKERRMACAREAKARLREERLRKLTQHAF